MEAGLHVGGGMSEDRRSLRPFLALLSAVADLAVSGQSPESIANGILDEMHQHRPFDRITLSAVDANRREIVVRAQAGVQDNGLPRGPRLSAADRPSKRRGAKTTLCLPLNYGDRLLGVLKIESRRGSIRPLDAQLARICGALLTSSLQSALFGSREDTASLTDELTGGKTRQYFLDALEREWKLSARLERPLSLVMLMLDGLSAVQSTRGPLERDLILARVGLLLERKCRRSNLVARYDESAFALLMPDTRAEQAQVLAERLRLWVEADPLLRERNVTGSFGLATYPLDGLNLEELLKRACQPNGLAVTEDIHSSPLR
jgi:diguanylate cyclase (GGDEF)-like protein